MYRKQFTFEGKRYDLTASTKTELAAKVALKKRDIEEGRKQITKNMTVRDWSVQWLEVYKEYTVGPDTLGTYKAALNRINAEIGGMMLKDVKSLQCQNILNKMEGESWSGVTKMQQDMRQLFAGAIKNGLLIENPADDLTRPKTIKGTHRALTEHERKILLKVCNENPYGLWALVIYYCGLRPGETDKIIGKHIDLKNRILHVDGTKTDAAERDVPIPEKLAARLPNVSAFDHLFKNSAGRPINKTNRRRMWESITKSMHIAMGGKTDYGKKQRLVPPYLVADDLVPYCLRHDFCTRLEEAGVPINIAKELMGHKDIRTTANIYTHFNLKSFEYARKKIDAYNSL